MGIGRFDQTSHKFNLVLSINYDATADLNQLKQSFQRASELLYDATDGKHQFGEITVCLNSSGGNNADIWVIVSPDPTNPVVDSDGYYPPPFSTPTPGIHMTLDKLVKDFPLLIVHEFGHFVYGLYDEYRFPDASTGAHCVGGGANVCIMEASQADGDSYNPATGNWIPGVIKEFCVLGNHTTDNEQGAISCWQTMASLSDYYDLNPIPTLPDEAPPTTPAAALINWVVLETTQRFVLVIDRSGSMMGDKLVEAKLGADWWVDAILSNDALAIVSFSDTSSLVYDFPPPGSSVDPITAHQRIQDIMADGLTSIGGGLRTAYNALSLAGPRTVAESIVLLTDGRQNSGEHPNTVLPDLIARGVKVYTIGIGTDVDPILLQNIASQTGGTYYVSYP